MKIFLLISSMQSGGAESHVYTLGKTLAARGHEVTVFSAGGSTADALRAEGVRHIRLTIDSAAPLKLPSLLLSRLVLLGYIKKKSPDIVHAHSRIAAFVGSSAAKRTGTCFVTTVHARFKDNRIKKMFSRWGRAQIAVGEDLRDWLASNYPRTNADKIRVIPNGIDTSVFLPSAKKKGRNIAFVSRLECDCSLAAQLLLEIAPKLKKNFPDIQLTVAGGGEMYKNLSEKAEGLNRTAGEEYIFMPGRVEDVAKLLARCHIFVGVSRAALEAMSCGLPVILAGNEGYFGTLAGENLESAARSNFCARGSEMPSADKLYADLYKLLSSPPSYRIKTGQILRNYILENNSIQTCATLTEDFYRESIKNAVRPKRGGILLCGYYGYKNSGDDAMFAAAIARAKHMYSDKEITALVSRNCISSDFFGIRCAGRKNIFSVVREIKRCDCLVFGGGSLIQDKTSFRSLVYYCTLLILAHRMGKRTELWGNGIGPVNSKIGQRLAAVALRTVNYIGLRDENSVRLALRLGADAEKITRENDLAASIMPQNPGRIDYLLEKYNLSGKGFALIAPKGKCGLREKKRLSSEINTLRLRNIQPVFVPMFQREDGKICREFSEKYCLPVLYNLTGRDFTGLMQHAETAVGMRLHALIFAHAAGKPFTGIGSDPKILEYLKAPDAVRTVNDWENPN